MAAAISHSLLPSLPFFFKARRLFACTVLIGPLREAEGGGTEGGDAGEVQGGGGRSLMVLMLQQLPPVSCSSMGTENHRTNCQLSC